MAELAAVETEHLLLRPWEASDGSELERLMADPAVRGGRSFGAERIVRMAEHSARQWRVNGFGPWAAIDKASAAWIGRIGLDELAERPATPKTEAGIEPPAARRGRGLATEGRAARVRFGF